MNLLTSTDLAFQLNDGKFEYNKRCGYVVLGLLFVITVHKILLTYVIMYSVLTLTCYYFFSDYNLHIRVQDPSFPYSPIHQSITSRQKG